MHPLRIVTFVGAGACWVGAFLFPPAAPILEKAAYLLAGWAVAHPADRRPPDPPKKATP